MMELILPIVGAAGSLAGIGQFVSSFFTRKNSISTAAKAYVQFNEEILKEKNATTESLKTSLQWLQALNPYAEQILKKQATTHLIFLLLFLLFLYLSIFLLPKFIIGAMSLDVWTLTIIITVYFFYIWGIKNLAWDTAIKLPITKDLDIEDIKKSLSYVINSEQFKEYDKYHIYSWMDMELSDVLDKSYMKTLLGISKDENPNSAPNKKYDFSLLERIYVQQITLLKLSSLFESYSSSFFMLPEEKYFLSKYLEMVSIVRMLEVSYWISDLDMHYENLSKGTPSQLAETIRRK